MAARGVLFALDRDDTERLLACRDDDEVMRCVEEIEEPLRLVKRPCSHGPSPGNAADIAYTQAFLPGLKDFYRAAAQNGMAVVFTVDQ